MEEKVDEYMIQERLERENIKEMEEVLARKDKDEGDADPKVKRKRTNERPIGYVIDKVMEWREKFSDKNQKFKLKDAADMVGISKKSLDDYVLQIRKGFLYGFNFNQHRHDKVGVLREFNRKKDN